MIGRQTMALKKLNISFSGFKVKVMDFIGLSIRSFICPDKSLTDLEQRPLYGMVGYALSALLMLAIMSYTGTVAGFEKGSLQFDFAFASVIVLPFFVMIPVGFIHLNATALKMGGSYWLFYSRVLWSLYLWCVASLVAGLIIYPLIGILPAKVLGFLGYLPYFYAMVMIYLSLKITNDLTHLKTAFVLGVTSGLFYVALSLVP